MQVLLRVVIIMFLAGTAFAQKQQPLRFEDFPVNEKFSGKSVPVKISGAQARKYRTALKDNAKEGVNFAGHYVLATWGCGTDCRELAIIDARTGTVYFTPSLLLVAGELGQEEDRLQFKKNSRLLLVVGLRNDEFKGRYYYLWENNRLKLIRQLKK